MEIKMQMPKFKPTKWKLTYCSNCKRIGTGSNYYCRTDKHNTLEIENVPFFVPDMQIEYVGSKWSGLISEKMGRHFMLSASKLEKIILGCGIEPKGKISNKWWMYNKVGGSLTIAIVEDE